MGLHYTALAVEASHPADRRAAEARGGSIRLQPRRIEAGVSITGERFRPGNSGEARARIYRVVLRFPWEG